MRGLNEYYPLNSHFLLFVSLAQIRDRRPLRKGERQRIFSSVGAHSVRPCLNLSAVSDNLLLHISAALRRRDIPVSRNSLTCYTGRHLRIRRLILFVFAGAVYHNALTNCAALLCRACEDFPVCVAEHYLTLRTSCSRGRTPKVVRPQQRKILCRTLIFEAVAALRFSPS